MGKSTNNTTKSSKGGSSKKGGKATTAIACQCADPYQCICGNRSERPSRYVRANRHGTDID